MDEGQIDEIAGALVAAIGRLAKAISSVDARLDTLDAQIRELREAIEQGAHEIQSTVSDGFRDLSQNRGQ